MKMIIGYQPAKFHISRLSGSNFTKVGTRHKETSKIAHFVEYSIGKTPSPPSDLQALKKPSPYRVKVVRNKIWKSSYWLI